MATTPSKALRKMRHNNTVRPTTKENTMSTIPAPLVNSSQAKKLDRLTREAKIAKNHYEKLEAELKEYRNSLPIPQGETQIGAFKIKKTWRDGNEVFDLKKFRESFEDTGHLGDASTIIRKAVEEYVGRGKGYYLFTVTSSADRG